MIITETLDVVYKKRDHEPIEYILSQLVFFFCNTITNVKSNV
jgi:hypothetical protein